MKETYESLFDLINSYYEDFKKNGMKTDDIFYFETMLSEIMKLHNLIQKNLLKKDQLSEIDELKKQVMLRIEEIVPEIEKTLKMKAFW